MSTRPLLSNGPQAVRSEEDYEVLQRQIKRIKGELDDVRNELNEVRRQRNMMEQSLLNLRKVLSPLFLGLKAVFGEIESVVGSDDGQVYPNNPQGTAEPRVSVVWESWKQKLGGGSAKVIDALLLHGEMTTVQLAIATGLHRTTISTLIYSLNKASLINKDGGRFSLKQL